MELNYMREFVQLVKVENYSRAADNMFISQSSLSKHIKSLETELGVDLFEHGKRPVRLTAFGECFYEYAVKIVQIQDEMNKDMLTVMGKQNTVLAVRPLFASAPYNVSHFLADFIENNPNVSLKLVESQLVEQEDKLRKGEIDFSFLFNVGERKNDEFGVVTYMQDHLVALLPKGHPLVDNESIDIAQLSRETLVVPPEYSIIFSMLRREFEKSGLEPKISYTSSRQESLIDLAANMHCVGISTSVIAKHTANQDVSILEIAPQMHFNINIMYYKNREMSYAARRFMRYLNDTLGKQGK